MAKILGEFSFSRPASMCIYIDQIGGWSLGKADKGYGEGYTISKLRNRMLELDRTLF